MFNAPRLNNRLITAIFTLSVFSLTAQGKITLSGELKQGGLVIGKTSAKNGFFCEAKKFRNDQITLKTCF